MIQVGFLTADGRELLKRYEHTQPIFGTAPEGLL